MRMDGMGDEAGQVDTAAVSVADTLPDDSVVDGHWYVAETIPRNEDKAASNLRRQGYSVYLPRYRKIRRHARRTDTVLAPLFPNYVFVGFDPAVAVWRPINGTFGVKRLVTSGGLPAQVPVGVVEGLRIRADIEGVISLDEPPPFKPGETLRVMSGPFTDSLAVFRGLDDRQRVTVLLSLLGREVSVRLDRHAVEKAG